MIFIIIAFVVAAVLCLILAVLAYRDLNGYVPQRKRSTYQEVSRESQGD